MFMEEYADIRMCKCAGALCGCKFYHLHIRTFAYHFIILLQ